LGQAACGAEGKVSSKWQINCLMGKETYFTKD